MRRTLLIAATLATLSSGTAMAETFIVEDGRPGAEIVVAPDPPRTTRLAARELQTYVRKISGATLEIVSKPSGTVPIRLFVGRSAHTDALGVDPAGLEDGAYRIVSGDDWLVLIGDDTNFEPIEPWPRNNADVAGGRMQRAWDEITGEHWGYVHSQLHKHYSGPNVLFETPREQKVDDDGNVHVWTYDERGSFNAVCGFLRHLGVRWYMPGEIGEVVPRRRSIPLPEIDETVRPDFPMRILNFRPAVYGRDAMMWGFRLGVRQPYGRQAAHGLRNMTDNAWTLENRPDWFALYGGKRHNDPKVKNNQLCYSNEELLGEAVRFARVQFDHFDMDVVSIMPPDGYTAMCQCEHCRGGDSPELGSRGHLSNHVWDFVNRVAKEVARTHPDKRISCCAYGAYTAPPSNIEKLASNVQVIIVGGRRPTSPDRGELRKLRAAWAEKSANPIEVFENYPFTGRGFYLPAYVPGVLGQSINETKGVSRGEDIWLTMDFGENAIGFNHFLVYFTARMYWGGPDRDVGAMFDEYCRLFYGQASSEMQAFLRYCEDHWREMEHDADVAGRALELFAVARTKVDADSIHGRRIQLIDNYLDGLRNKRTQLAQKRGPVPQLRLVGRSSGEIVVDGRLDDDPWVNCPTASTGRLRELQTGRRPTFGTTVRTAWIGRDLYFAVRCDEATSGKPNVAATRDGDQAIWYGDVVEFLLDTDSHHYYQIAVSPSGAVVDLDRGATKSKWFDWSSQAEVATHVAEDHWTVEIRIPVTTDENDPLHQVIGHRPTQSLPWHVNVCRQRVRETGSELSAFAPTGTSSFHAPMKFGHFYGGRSHRFPADESVTDCPIALDRAAALVRAGRFGRAIDAYMAIADDDVTDFQKSAALAGAAACARSLDDAERADEIAAGIPIDTVAKTVRIENLLAQRDFETIVERFGDEDLGTWPFWQAGAGAWARARAHVALKDGTRAEADLTMALVLTSDPRTRTTILSTLGSNRERNLNDLDGALKAYRLNFDSKSSIGAADEFRSVQGAARILARRGRHDEALETLKRAAIESRTGYWRHELLLTRGGILADTDRGDEAARDFRTVFDDATASKAHRRAAEDHIERLDH